MQLFEDLIKCKDCMNNINNKCILYPGKDTKEENTGCYVGIDRNNKQKLAGGILKVKENSINKKEIDNGIKINIPIISNQEIENTINKENLYDKIAEQIYHDREMIILQEFIKKLQKENEKLKNQEATQRKINELLVQRYSNSIPVQKVKDIIDRIDYDIKKTKEIILKNTNIYASYRKNDYQIVRLKAMNTKSLDIKKRLQELLESEE